MERHFNILSSGPIISLWDERKTTILRVTARHSGVRGVGWGQGQEEGTGVRARGTHSFTPFPSRTLVSSRLLDSAPEGPSESLCQRMGVCLRLLLPSVEEVRRGDQTRAKVGKVLVRAPHSHLPTRAGEDTAGRIVFAHPRLLGRAMDKELDWGGQLSHGDFLNPILSSVGFLELPNPQELGNPPLGTWRRTPRSPKTLSGMLWRSWGLRYEPCHEATE